MDEIKRKRGRPKSPDKRSLFISIRLNPDEKRIIRSGIGSNDVIRALLIQLAKKKIEE